MRPAKILAAVLLVAWAAASFAQIRTEKDAEGRTVITNKGSRSAARLAGSPSSKPLPSITPGQREAIRKSLRAACREKGLDYNLVAALVQAESGFRPNVLSKKGAVGLMQLMPDTAKRFGCSNPWDMEENIKAGTAFLAYLHTLFPENIPLVLAAYNAGEDAVRKYGNRIPPYAETVRYVFLILEDYGRRSLIEDAKALLASPSDYNRYFVAHRDEKPTYRVYYMFVDEKGVRHFYDYIPSGVQAQTILFKND